MFKRGLVITNAFKVWPGAAHMVKRLKEEFYKLDIAVDVLDNASVLAMISSTGNVETKKLPYDFIVYLDKDYYIASLLEKAGYKLFNNAELLRICDDKMLTHLALVNHDIKMPKTISFPLKYAEASLELFLNNVIEELGFPMIVKESFGSLGEQVYLVENKEKLLEIEEKISDKPHIFQEYIETSFGRDMRVVLIGGKVVAWMKRVAQVNGEFRSNIETGGIGFDDPLEESFKVCAEKVARILGIDYCGLDLLYGREGEPIFYEINANAFLEPIEKYSGRNVGKMYTEYIYNKIYK